jgi:IstB-like ATP binding protein
MMICASRTVHVKISSSSGFVAQPGIKALDEFGYVPLSTRDAECLFEVFSQRYERGSPTGTSNPPFDGWAGVFGSERPTGALRDRLTHHANILEMNRQLSPQTKQAATTPDISSGCRSAARGERQSRIHRSTGKRGYVINLATIVCIQP